MNFMRSRLPRRAVGLAGTAHMGVAWARVQEIQATGLPCATNDLGWCKLESFFVLRPLLAESGVSTSQAGGASIGS
jgi:hypothetical protein